MNRVLGMLELNLSEKQERYALDDVRFLLPLHDRLGEELKTLGRELWASEEFRRYEDPTLYQVDRERLYQRIRRASSLDGSGLAILQELAQWREDEAVERDKPRRSVVSDEILVEIARLRPKRPPPRFAVGRRDVASPHSSEDLPVRRSW